MTQQSLGFDWGLGQTNIDRKTGIRYGVIHAGEVGQAWKVYSVETGKEIKP